MYDQISGHLHLTQWRWISSPANKNQHSAWWDKSPLLKKQIFYERLQSGFMRKVFIFYFLFCCLFFPLHSHIFQVFLPPLIYSPFLLSLWLFTTLLFFPSWHERSFIFSNPRPFSKTFRSFSNLESNCANNSLRQLEPYMVHSLVMDAGHSLTLASYCTLPLLCNCTVGCIRINIPINVHINT